MWTDNIIAFRFIAQSSQWKGPNCSTPVFEKSAEGSNCSSIRSAMTGVIVCAPPFLQPTHLLLVGLRAFRMPRMLIFSWIMFLTCPVPSLWLFLCSFSMNNSTAWCFQLCNIGNLSLKFNLHCPICLRFEKVLLHLRRMRIVRFCCLLEFLFQLSHISILYQTVLVVVTWRWLL